MPNKKHQIIFITLCIASTALLVLGLSSGHSWGDDFAGYIHQAKSITQGTTSTYLENNQRIINESSSPIGPTSYPWGLPVILSAIYACFGESILHFKAVGILSYLLLLPTIWLGFKHKHSPTWLLCFVALFAFNPTLIQDTHHILSDIPFMLLSTLAVLAIQQTINSLREQKSSYPQLILLALLMFAATTVRSNGILLPATLFASYLIYWLKFRQTSQPNNTKKTLLKLTIPLLTFVALLLAWRTLLPSGGSSHLHHFTQITPAMIWQNIVYYTTLPADFFHGTPIPTIIFLTSLPLFFYGAYKRAAQDFPTLIYLAATMFLYIIWPSQQGIRFLFPLLPFYISFTLTGCSTLYNLIPKKDTSAKIAITLPFIFILSAFTHHHIFNLPSKEKIGPYAPATTDIISKINTHTTPSETIIFFKPRFLHLATERPTLMINSPDQISKGSYLCYGHHINSSKQITKPQLQQLIDQQQLVEITKNNNFTLYKIIPKK